MPQSSPAELRIYCICGQKMKVSDAMFGLPGKCIACRQKIRIPKPDELPPDTQEVSLKDHPEFLRKSRRKTPKFLSKQKKEPQEIALGEPAPAPVVPVAPMKTPPLDILEPLRMLCSLEHKLKREMKDGSASEAGLSESTLQGYLDRVKSARNDVDEQLRQRLMEVVIELAGTHERIVQSGLSARLGEVDYADFRDTVEQLRRRRDILERLQHNIKGWLAVNDPYQAGGYANVTFENVPGDRVKLSLPIERPDPRPLIDQHVEGLRDALARRERADRRLAETKRVEAEGVMPTPVLADCRGDCEAEKARAEAEIAFRRARLEAVKGDAAADNTTVGAHLDVMRKRFNGSGMEKGHFAQLEQQLLQAQRDSQKLQDAVTRALAANNAGDVPRLQGTFLERIVKAQRQFRSTMSVTVESYFAWAAAFILGLAVFLPVIDDLSPLEAFRIFRNQPLHWLMVLPLFLGVIAAMSQIVKPRQPRGILLLALSVLLTVGGAYLIHESGYGFNPIAARFRNAHAPLIRVGTFALMFSDAGLFVAAIIALWPERRSRPFLPVAVIVAMTALVALFTNLGGYYEPRPSFTVKSIQRFVDNRLMYDTSVLVKNAGAREMFLNEPSKSGRNLYAYSIERNEGESWVEAGNPVNVMSNGSDHYGSRSGSIGVKGKSTTLLQYRLIPGNYRLTLADTDGAPIQSEAFILDAPAQPPIRPVEPIAPVPAEIQPAAQETVTPAPAVNTPPHPVEIELKGIIVANGHDPRFSMVLHMPNGTTRSLDIVVGDIVYDPWTVTEYNSTRQTITLSDGQDRLLIVERGQSIPLE